jgi:broad specificity phosphatase PhoE
LRKGGYVLFIRHPKTNPDQADTAPLHLDNIKAQRQLSEEGRKQAKALGEAFRALPSRPNLRSSRTPTASMA